MAQTDVFNVAVALATFGYRYELEKPLVENAAALRSSEVGACRWQFSTQPVLYVKAAEDEPMPQIQSQTLLRLIRTRELESADPGHPVLHVLQGLNIYECLRSFMERARDYRIALQKGCSFFTLIPGEEPMRAHTVPTVTTDSLELATVLIRLGHAPLRCEGSAPRRQIVLSAQSYRPESPAATEIARLLDSGDLQRSAPDHPALWCLAGLRNRAAMKAEMNGKPTRTILRNPRSIAWLKRYRCVYSRGLIDSTNIDRARGLL